MSGGGQGSLAGADSQSYGDGLVMGQSPTPEKDPRLVKGGDEALNASSFTCGICFDLLCEPVVGELGWATGWSDCNPSHHPARAGWPRARAWGVGASPCMRWWKPTAGPLAPGSWQAGGETPAPRVHATLTLSCFVPPRAPTRTHTQVPAGTTSAWRAYLLGRRSGSAMAAASSAPCAARSCWPTHSRALVSGCCDCVVLRARAHVCMSSS
jgi:hypothetical protein